MTAAPAAIDSIDARTGQVLASVASSSLDEISTAAAAAGELFRHTRGNRSDAPLRLLAALADELTADAAELISVADRETALGVTRLTGELARTAFQLRAFTDIAVQDHLVGALRDTPDSERIPPRSGQVRRNVPLGPVAVFAASNFPFAFGILGGDTASALGAGCPVVVKAHPAQPSTGERLTRAVARAIAAADADPAWLRVVAGAAPEAGAHLVRQPSIAAVGFTGSTSGGTALVAEAAKRPQPIPVFAEMGSVNPSYVGPAAAAARATDIATSWAATLSGNAGQFCTKPGLLLVPATHAATVAAVAREHLAGTDVPPMVHPLLADGYRAALDRATAVDGVSAPVEPVGAAGNGVPSAVLELTAATLLAHPQLADEIFGPAGAVVACADGEQERLAAVMPGSLASSIIADPDDAGWVRSLLPLVERNVGRIVFNTWPTGVSIGWSTVHGGPWPATSMPASTSVGYTAALRWLRPVAYEHFPAELLPEALRTAT